MSINANAELNFDDKVQILELDQLITDPDDDCWANCLVIIRHRPMKSNWFTLTRQQQPLKYYAVHNVDFDEKNDDGTVSVSIKMKELTPHQLMKWDMHELVVDEISEGHLQLEDLTNKELRELYTEGYIDLDDLTEEKVEELYLKDFLTKEEYNEYRTCIWGRSEIE